MNKDDIRRDFPEDSLAASLSLPTPTLQLDFRMSVTINPKIDIGEGPWGQRNWISFSGGRWNATWGSGTVEVCTPIRATVTASHPHHRTVAPCLTSVRCPARRSRLSTRKLRDPIYVRRDELPAQDFGRDPSVHRREDVRMAHGPARSVGEALRSCTGEHRKAGRVLFPRYRQTRNRRREIQGQAQHGDLGWQRRKGRSRR
jgi:hypothetical protein